MKNGFLKILAPVFFAALLGIFAYLWLSLNGRVAAVETQNTESSVGIARLEEKMKANTDLLLEIRRDIREIRMRQ